MVSCVSVYCTKLFTISSATLVSYKFIVKYTFLSPICCYYLFVLFIIQRYVQKPPFFFSFQFLLIFLPSHHLHSHNFNFNFLILICFFVQKTASPIQSFFFLLNWPLKNLNEKKTVGIHFLIIKIDLIEVYKNLCRKKIETFRHKYLSKEMVPRNPLTGPNL